MSNPYIINCEKLPECGKIIQQKTDLFNKNYPIGIVADLLMVFCIQCHERIPGKLELKND